MSESWDVACEVLAELIESMAPYGSKVRLQPMRGCRYFPLELSIEVNHGDRIILSPAFPVYANTTAEMIREGLKQLGDYIYSCVHASEERPCLDES